MPSRHHPVRPAPAGPARIGLVGPGRTRNGLGPFLARHLASAGARVVAVAGRDGARTAAAAVDLAQQLGHPVVAHASLSELVGRGDLDALVVASPIAAHLAALRAGLAARLPTLCEKPLADRHEAAAVEAIVAAYAQAGVPLLENCQWPFALDRLRQAGALPPGAPRQVAMRLSPSGCGRAMVVESLSHLLSLLQAVLPLAPDAALADVAFSTRAADAAALRLQLGVATGAGACAASLELVRCPEQPRPAWFELDGARFERELVLPQYLWRFRHAQGSDTIGDPQADLVYSFVRLLSEPDLAIARRHAASIQTRARLFAAILARYDE